MDQLSGIDASFLHLETPETPMHVGGLELFELPAGYTGDFYEDVKAVIAKRMHVSPLLTRKLAPMPFELAEPVWIDDDDIDLDYHIRNVTLRRPGTMEQLEQLIARLHSSLLDRSRRPLWEMYVIDGLESRSRSAFTSRATIAASTARPASSLPRYCTIPRLKSAKCRRRAASARARAVSARRHRTAAGSRNQCRPAVPQAGGSAADRGEGVQHGGRRHRQPAGAEGPARLEPWPRPQHDIQPVNHQPALLHHNVGADGGYQDTELGKRIGGTVNTIVMAMCSIALERFLKERNLLPKEGLIALVPVSLRAEAIPR